MSIGILKGVALLVNDNNTEEHYSDGKLAGQSRYVFI